MTLQATPRKVTFNGNGSATSFPFTFKIFSATDLRVLRVEAGGTEIPLTLDSDFSVFVNTPQEGNPGGRVTYPVSGDPLPNGAKLIVYSELEPKQETDLRNASGYFPETLEDRLDYITAMIQEHAGKLARTLLTSIADDSPVLDLRQAADRAGKVLSFDENGGAEFALPLPEGALTETNVLALLTQQNIGAKLYPLNTDEISAGLTDNDVAHEFYYGDIRRYGAVVGSTDASATRAAIQMAIDVASWVFIPEGTWLIDEALQWRSGSHIAGAGMDRTVIRMDDAAHEDINGFEPATKNGTTVSWSISQLTVDGNFSRPTVSGTGAKRPGSSCIATMGARVGSIRRVRVKDAVLHGLDICNGGETDSGSHYYVAPTNRASDYYPSNESQHIWIDEIIAEDCGDDAITGHYSKDIYVGRVFASSTGGRHSNPAASNCFEIDDGCRRWFIDFIKAEGGNRGFASKTHLPEPSPSDIQIGRLHITGCRQGVYIDGRHSDFDSGFRIQIGSVIVRSPAEVNGELSDVDIEAVRIRDAEHVTIGEIIAEAEGTEEFVMSAAVALVTNASTISIGRIVAVNWPYSNDDSSTLGGVTVTSSTSRVSIGSIHVTDCGFRGVLVTGDTGCMIGMVNAALTSPITGSVGIRFTVDPATSSNYIGGESVSGYATDSIYGSP